MLAPSVGLFAWPWRELTQVVYDALVGHLLARPLVNRVKHRIQQVLPVGRMRLPRLQHIFGRLSHDGNILGQLPISLPIKDSRKRTTRSVARLGKKATHGLDEGVQLIVVERVEAVVHGAQRQRVESQPREVVRDHDGVRGSMAGPLHGQLADDVVHLVEHAVDGHGPEGGRQDAVGDAPVLFFRADCGEEPVVDALADLVEDAPDVLLEAFFVADLVYELVARDEYCAAAGEVQFVDLSWRVSSVTVLATHRLTEQRTVFVGHVL